MSRETLCGNATQPPGGARASGIAAPDLASHRTGPTSTGLQPMCKTRRWPWESGMAWAQLSVGPPQTGPGSGQKLDRRLWGFKTLERGEWWVAGATPILGLGVEVTPAEGPHWGPPDCGCWTCKDKRKPPPTNPPPHQPLWAPGQPGSLSGDRVKTTAWLGGSGVSHPPEHSQQKIKPRNRQKYLGPPHQTWCRRAVGVPNELAEGLRPLGWSVHGVGTTGARRRG